MRIEIRSENGIDVDLSARLQDRFGLQHAVVVDTSDDDADSLRAVLGRAAASRTVDALIRSDQYRPRAAGSERFAGGGFAVRRSSSGLIGPAPAADVKGSKAAHGKPVAKRGRKARGLAGSEIARPPASRQRFTDDVR